MSARGRMMATIAGVVLVLLVGFLFGIRPQQGKLADANTEVDTANSETVQLKSELARLQQLQEDAPKFRAQLEEIRRRVPVKDEVFNFILQVQDAANRSGVSFLRVTPELPKPPPEGAALAEVRVQIGAQGGYFAAQDFIRRLYDLDRALRMDVLTMSASDAEPEAVIQGQVQMEATVRIFFELPLSTVGTAGTAPGAPGQPTPTPSP